MLDINNCNSTLVIALGNVSLVITVILAVQYYLYPSIPGLKLWMYAFIMRVVGAVIHVLSNIWPYTLVDALPSCAILVSNILLWFGTRQFVGRTIYPKLAISCLVFYIVALLISYNTSLINEINPEAVSVLCFALGSLLASFELFSKTDSKLKSIRFSAIVFFLHGFVILFFIVISSVFQDEINFYEDQRGLGMAMQISIPLNILFAFSIILLSSELFIRKKSLGTDHDIYQHQGNHRLNKFLSDPQTTLPPHTTVFIIQLQPIHTHSTDLNKKLTAYCANVIYKQSKMDDIITIYNTTNVLGVLFNTSPGYAEAFKSMIKDAINIDIQLKQHSHFSIGFHSTQTHESLKSLINKAENSMVNYKTI